MQTNKQTTTNHKGSLVISSVIGFWMQIDSFFFWSSSASVGVFSLTISGVFRRRKTQIPMHVTTITTVMINKMTAMLRIAGLDTELLQLTTSKLLDRKARKKSLFVAAIEIWRKTYSRDLYREY